jgi:uncharacterized Zn finger protein
VQRANRRAFRGNHALSFQNNFPPRSAGQPGIPAPKAPLLRPRKVRGGVKLAAGQGVGIKAPEPGPDGQPAQNSPPPQSWAAQRWGRFVEQVAPGANLAEGLDYALQGQTKRLSVQAGMIDASVQGREFRAYVTRLEFATFKEEQWHAVVAALADSAIYSAKLLSGEVPANIEDIFAPLGLKLFPSEPGDVKSTCTCGPRETVATPIPGGVAIDGQPMMQPALPESSPPIPAAPHSTSWCKHGCCVAHLFAARLSSDPFLMFVLRGIEAEDLRERLRQKRVVVGAATGSMPVYSQRISGASDVSSPPLDQSLQGFYDAGESLASLETPIMLPPVSHPLLRRLGSSPFLSAPFPLVGLLASCYETISAETIEAAQRSPAAEGATVADPAEDAADDAPDDPEEPRPAHTSAASDAAIAEAVDPSNLADLPAESSDDTDGLA